MKDDLLEKADILAAAGSALIDYAPRNMNFMAGGQHHIATSTIRIAYVFEKVDHGYDTSYPWETPQWARIRTPCNGPICHQDLYEYTVNA